MTALRKHLVKLIEESGPISVARYMAEALGHPDHGYYMTRDPLGRGGDFITSPEISQMFGELVGLWLASEWQRMGEPDRVVLVELGPGRGTLMADALRAIEIAAPGFAKAIELHLVETSPVLKAAQQKKLSAAGAHWHDALETVPQGPLLVVANEFFDALPIRQFELSPDGAWCERLIGVKDGKLCFMTGPSLRSRDVSEFHQLSDAPPRSVLETCPAAKDIAKDIATRLAEHRGAALVIDYGYARHAYGETLQAISKHKFADVLERPGSADLTAHVDFQTLSEALAAAKARTYGPVEQGIWLSSLGITIRAEALKESAPEAERKKIDQAVQRLIDADAMGALFKVMAATDSGAPPPAGFDKETGHVP